MNAPTSFDQPRKIGLRASDYLMLSDAGAFDHVGRTELIEGEIWAMNAVHSWHARMTTDLVVELGHALKETNTKLRLFSAGSVLLSDDSVPEPDIAIAEDNTHGVLPLAKLKLAIEISDTTIAIDLGVKLRLYAQAEVPEYWVVDRAVGVIHQYWLPSSEGYAEFLRIAIGERIAATTLDGIAIDTNSLAR